VRTDTGTDLIPFLTIGAFAGVRHAEIQRLDWKDVRFGARIIEVHAGNAKTATRRTVPILPNLRAWLRDHREESGPVCPFANVTDQLVSLVTKINKVRSAKCGMRNGTGTSPQSGEGDQDRVEEFRWKHNGLRHSFISYRVAAIKNVAQVALEAGNSPAMIFSNYRELVTPGDARTWFAVAPKGTKAVRKKVKKGRRGKIVAFPAKAAA
jgi:integrase